MTTQHAKSNAREGDGVAAVADEMKFLAMAFPRADLQHGGAAIATLCTEIDKWADRLTDAMQAQQGAEPVAWVDDVRMPPLPECWSGSPVTVDWGDGERTTRDVYTLEQLQKYAIDYGESIIALATGAPR